MNATRRGFLFGAGASLLAAPSIVRVAANLMPVSTAAISTTYGLRPWLIGSQITFFNPRIYVFNYASRGYHWTSGGDLASWGAA